MEENDKISFDIKSTVKDDIIYVEATGNTSAVEWITYKDYATVYEPRYWKLLLMGFCNIVDGLVRVFTLGRLHSGLAFKCLCWRHESIGGKSKPEFPWYRRKKNLIKLYRKIKEFFRWLMKMV